SQSSTDCTGLGALSGPRNTSKFSRGSRGRDVAWTSVADGSSAITGRAGTGIAIEVAARHPRTIVRRPSPTSFLRQVHMAVLRPVVSRGGPPPAGGLLLFYGNRR